MDKGSDKIKSNGHDAVKFQKDSQGAEERAGSEKGGCTETLGHINAIREAAGVPGFDLKGLSPNAPMTEDGSQSQTDYAFHLLDAYAMLRMAMVMKEGMDKGKGRDAWRKASCEDHINHAIGHLFAHLGGDSQDDHLGHAACQAMMALAMERLPDVIPARTPVAEAGRPKTVYICHPYANSPLLNTERALGFARELHRLCPECLIIVPHLVMKFVGEEDEGNRVDNMKLCLRLVELCDELVVCGDRRTEGMLQEIAHAQKLGITCGYWRKIGDAII